MCKAGNPPLGTTMVELAWPVVANQPTSPLSLWFHERPAPWRADTQDDHRRPGAQALRRPVAVHHRWRHHRGNRDEGGANNDLIASARDPDRSCTGGRPEMAVWLRQPTERMVPTSRALPPNAGCWCNRNKRRPYVSLIWCSTPSGHGNGLRPWIRTNGKPDR